MYPLPENPNDFLKRHAVKRAFHVFRNGSRGAVGWGVEMLALDFHPRLLAATVQESWKIYDVNNQANESGGALPKVRMIPRHYVEAVFNVLQNLPEFMPRWVDSFRSVGLEWTRPGAICPKCRGRTE